MLVETWDRSPGVPWANIAAYIDFPFLDGHWPALAFEIQPRAWRISVKIGPMFH
jgi:hypothetical protein